MTIDKPLDVFGGIPFADSGFDARRLLAAVVAVRALREGSDDVEDAMMYLSPDRATLTRSVPSGHAISFTELSDDELQSVARSRDAIVAVMPEWATLLALPILYRRMTRDGVISASSFGYPQHVFLGSAAFATHRELREQLIHETVHNWMYLIAEVTRLELKTTTAPEYTLPSGTAHKAPSEVLGAMHVALSLIRYYAVRTRVPRADPEDAQRLEKLRTYVAACGPLAARCSSHLTPAGQQIISRLSLLSDRARHD